MKLLIVILNASVILSDSLFEVLQSSVLMTSYLSEPQPSQFLGYCAMLLGTQTGYRGAVFLERNQTCVMSHTSTVLVLGKNEPDDTSLMDESYAAAEGILLLVPGPGSNPANCADILTSDPLSPSGVYSIWPVNEQLRVWCDMDTDGGGWTMVYSYTTAVADYKADENAVIPVPTWEVTNPTVLQRSDIPPSDIHQYGAMDFPIWKTIGEEVMIKTNINNWIACQPGTGSFTRWVEGSISCRMIKSITTICPTLPTGQFLFEYNTRGPAISLDVLEKYYYYFDGTTSWHWPTHDPCGLNKDNHLPGIEPKGQIWVR